MHVDIDGGVLFSALSHIAYYYNKLQSVSMWIKWLKTETAVWDTLTNIRNVCFTIFWLYAYADVLICFVVLKWDWYSVVELDSVSHLNGWQTVPYSTFQLLFAFFLLAKKSYLLDKVCFTRQVQNLKFSQWIKFEWLRKSVHELKIKIKFTGNTATGTLDTKPMNK